MSISTIYILIKRELYEKRPNLIWLTIFNILILFFVAQKQLYSANWLDLEGFIRFLFVTQGAYISGLAFWEFNTAPKLRNYLLIPADNFEKAIAKLISYIFGWWVLFIFAWLIAGIIANIVFVSFTGTFVLSNMLHLLVGIFTVLLPSIPVIFLLQSLGVFASCYFKKSALFKLSVAILLIALMIAALMIGEVSILMKYFGFGLTSSFILQNLILGDTFSSIANPAYIIIGLIICAICCIRLRETEAR